MSCSNKKQTSKIHLACFRKEKKKRRFNCLGIYLASRHTAKTVKVAAMNIDFFSLPVEDPQRHSRTSHRLPIRWRMNKTIGENSLLTELGPRVKTAHYLVRHSSAIDFGAERRLRRRGLRPGRPLLPIFTIIFGFFFRVIPR